jgi:hypothetical protein
LVGFFHYNPQALASEESNLTTMTVEMTAQVIFVLNIVYPFVLAVGFVVYVHIAKTYIKSYARVEAKVKAFWLLDLEP